jgi:CRP/FNR family cyclic AMP-dependent transcriptional regulator
MDCGVDIRINQLARVRVFRHFGQEILAELAEAATLRKFAENTTFVHLGDTCSHIYVIVSGKVRLTVPLPDGREFIFSDLGSGDAFDLNNLFMPRNSRMNASSIFESDVLQIKVAFMASLFDRHPDLAIRLIPFFCQAAQEAQERVIQGTANTLSMRLASTLLRITTERHNAANAYAKTQRIRLSQTDLAAMVPASREKVNRCLREWERRDLTQFDNGSITILDRNRLTSIALGEGEEPFQIS